MKRIGEHRKNIASLESLWYSDSEESVTVIPILEIVSRMHEIKYSHLTCNTKTEFKYNLNLLRNKPDYGILYLAFHGEPRKIILASHISITLETLSDYMGEDFASWTVHFGACSTIDTDTSYLSSFIQSTGVSMVSGYTKHTDWIESAAMDLLLFQQLQHHKDMHTLWHQLNEQYGEFVSRTGLRAFFEQAP